MDTTNLNLNAADCIKSASNIGSTVYTNICNGTIQTVPWGSGDWISAAGVSVLTAFMLAFLGFISVMFFRLATDRF